MSHLVLFCAYRDWAIRVFKNLEKLIEKNALPFDLQVVSSPRSLDSLLQRGLKPDFGICVGWSWIIPESTLKVARFFGIHPSDLPAYAGGSPIQNQIDDGCVVTKTSLFELTNDLDSGPIISQSLLSLEGLLPEILDELAESSTSLLFQLLKVYPNIDFRPQQASIKAMHMKRLSASSGRIFHNELGEMPVRSIYNKIRGRMDPYPNAYIQDETGTLYFEKVRFDEH